MDFAAILLGGVTVFLEDLEPAVLGDDFLPFGVVLARLGPGDFLVPLTGVVETGDDFSAGDTSFSLCSFSISFSSLGGAENRIDNAKNLIYLKKKTFCNH